MNKRVTFWDKLTKKKAEGKEMKAEQDEQDLGLDNMLTGVFSSTTRNVIGGQLVWKKLFIARLF